MPAISSQILTCTRSRSHLVVGDFRIQEECWRSFSRCRVRCEVSLSETMPRRSFFHSLTPFHNVIANDQISHGCLDIQRPLLFLCLIIHVLREHDFFQRGGVRPRPVPSRSHSCSFDRATEGGRRILKSFFVINICHPCHFSIVFSFSPVWLLRFLLNCSLA